MEKDKKELIDLDYNLAKTSANDTHRLLKRLHSRHITMFDFMYELRRIVDRYELKMLLNKGDDNGEKATNSRG